MGDDTSEWTVPSRDRPPSAVMWLLRYVLLPAMLAIIVLIAVAGYFAYRDERVQGLTGDIRPLLAYLGFDVGPFTAAPSRVRVDLPPTDADTPLDSLVADEAVSAQEPTAAMAPTAVEVDSYPADALYPLESWEVVNDPAGFVDWVRVDGVLQPIDQPVRAAPGQIIEVSGWAGHRLLGMRFAEVLFSVCEIVIAGAPVIGERSDVAATVHPNLFISGWHARIAAEDIPACNGAAIRVWGRPPVGVTLRPIVGGRRVEIADQAPSAAADARPPDILRVPPMVLPARASQPVSVSLSVAEPPLVMRKCGRADCGALAETDATTFEAVIVERRDGWFLLQSALGAGWVPANAVSNSN